MRTPRRFPSAGGPTPGSPADLQAEADPESAARGIALRRLAAAPRTRAELAQDLASRNIPADVAAEVLDRLEAVGLVDDAAFACTWVESRHRYRGSARRVLRRELLDRGVAPELIEVALASIDDAAERERALALAERKAGSMRGLEEAVATRRLAGMLARRGYSQQVAVSVAREVVRASRAAAGA